MEKNSGQILIYVLFIMIVFAGVTLIITTLTTRELEMREMSEKLSKVQYAAEAGIERGRYYIKTTSSFSTPITIDKTFVPAGKNPLDNGYSYSVTITTDGEKRPNGLTCEAGAGNYCIDSWGESPQ
ncbi:MAG TPA: hypothetical protein PLL80_01015 [Candidatus Pacearchaeota archaeon]|nr:hypothetical protein [Candidatus Pacearchaeota archaeon]HOK94183.1 hypothetical protein [Candidatus Pacearchaeota archaeon]HPO75177.1 hypothetical protein [Candidatus Pacearchaeota archaeon]